MRRLLASDSIAWPRRARSIAGLIVTVGLMLMVGASVRAQTAGESLLSVDDGQRVRSVARLVKGRWVEAAACTASTSGRNRPGERLVATGGLEVATARPLAPGSADWLRLAPTIIGLFERREREQRVASDRTAGAPRAIDWIYTVDAAGQRLHYFEASRRVASASPDVDDDTDPPGTLRIAVAGFLQDAPTGVTPLGTKSELRWEQDGLPAGPSRPDLTPLGVVRQGDRSVWVMKRQTGGSVWFSLYEVGGGTGTRTLVTTRSGC